MNITFVAIQMSKTFAVWILVSDGKSFFAETGKMLCIVQSYTDVVSCLIVFIKGDDNETDGEAIGELLGEEILVGWPQWRNKIFIFNS